MRPGNHQLAEPQRWAVGEAQRWLATLTAALGSVRVRPARRECTPDGYGTGSLFEEGPMNEWLEIGCCCTGACTCRADCEIKLPGPVVSIVEVRVNGQEIPPAAYTLQGDHLIRTDGHCWPDCQDLGRPDSEPDTWSVTYRRGREVPPGGRAAAAVLANEILKACTGQSGCRLPQRVKELTREGVSMTLMDDMEFLSGGRTGIGEVDQWLAAVNPGGLRSRPQVWSPDGPKHRTR